MLEKNKNKFLFLTVLLFNLFFAFFNVNAAIYTIPSSNRLDVSLNNNTWKFNKGDISDAESVSYNDSAWTSISLPHTWNNLDG